MRLILTLLLAVAPTIALAEPDPVKLSKCQYGVVVAQNAYLTGTFDAQRPNLSQLDYLVDYIADDLVIDLDRPVAKRAVIYIAAVMKESGVRRPHEGLMYVPVKHALNQECAKYMEAKP